MKLFHRIHESVKGIWFFLKVFFGELLIMGYAEIFGYYKRLDEIPIFNWFEVLNGKYNYLYKKRIKKVPSIFGQVYMNIFYQMDRINADYFRKIHKLAYLRSLHATTDQVRYLNQANFLEAEIIKTAKNPDKGIGLNDMLNIIEETFNNIGMIDKYKMDAARFYSLYYRAEEKIKAKNREYANTTA